MDDRRPADRLEERRWRKLLAVFHAVRRYSRALDKQERAQRKAGAIACIVLLVLFLSTLLAYLQHAL